MCVYAYVWECFNWMSALKEITSFFDRIWSNVRQYSWACAFVCVCVWNACVTKSYYVYVSFGYSWFFAHFFSLLLLPPLPIAISPFLYLVSRQTAWSALKLCWNFAVPISFLRDFISEIYTFFRTETCATRELTEFSARTGVASNHILSLHTCIFQSRFISHAHCKILYYNK